MFESLLGSQSRTEFIMVISVSILLFVMFFHWYADFVCQTHEMATGKSTSNYWLSYHVGVYTLIMAVMASGLLPSLVPWVSWVAFNGIAHWITDYFTSRWSSKYFKKQDFHNGFVVVGIDQFIHLACLVSSTAYFLN